MSGDLAKWGTFHLTLTKIHEIL